MSVRASDVLRVVSPRLLAWLVLAALPMVWNVRVTGTLSFAVVACSIGWVWLCRAYGSAIRHLAGPLVTTSGAAFEMLTGFIAVNTLLFVLILSTPFGMETDCLLLGAGGLTLFGLLRHRRGVDVPDGDDEWGSLACIVVCGLAALLWTRDQQPLMHAVGVSTVVNAWPDIYIHAREISAFAASHGASTISDVTAARTTAPLYHVASYMTSAAFLALTGTSALDVFASFLLPFGLLLVGLGAFVLGRALFGVWPAVVAAIAVVTLPDAYQQGFGVRLLSYHFMTQVNIGMLYGIALASLAWLFVIEGCRRQRLVAIVCGYILLLTTLSYKAHVFVANAYLLLIYPCLFYERIRIRWRVVIGVVFTVLFVAAVTIGQRNERVPIMRLDGSGLSTYVGTLLGAMDPGHLKDWFDRTLIANKPPKAIAAAWEALLIGCATAGVWLAALPIVLWLQRRRWPRVTLWFPLLVLANYFVMALGLALDSRRVGLPEELLNRPSAWAYFIVVVWTVAGAYRLCLGPGLPSTKAMRVGLASLAPLALVGVYAEAQGLQTFPAWDSYSTYAKVNAVPTCMVEAARYIRDHARAEDLIQDDALDPHLAFTAIAERQAFALDSSFGGTVATRETRLRQVRDLATSGDATKVVDFMRREGIAWYLVTPRASSYDAAASGDPVAFSCGGYRLLHAS